MSGGHSMGGFCLRGPTSFIFNREEPEEQCFCVGFRCDISQAQEDRLKNKVVRVLGPKDLSEEQWAAAHEAHLGCSLSYDVEPRDLAAEAAEEAEARAEKEREREAARPRVWGDGTPIFPDRPT